MVIPVGRTGRRPVRPVTRKTFPRLEALEFGVTEGDTGADKGAVFEIPAGTSMFHIIGFAQQDEFSRF